MHILIVDDEIEKAQDLQRCLNDGGVTCEVTHVTTAASARRELARSSVDLLVVDLNLPDTLGAGPTGTGGLAFFDLVTLDLAARLPREVVFITAKEDLVAESRSEVERRGGFLYTYGRDDSWKVALLGKARYIQRAKERAEALRADVLIITALRKPELSAVLALNYGWSAVAETGEALTLHSGTAVGPQGRPLKVVAACAQRKGMASSAALASRLAVLCKPRLVVMLGICAGRRSKTKFGDVIVADPAWDWGSGKQMRGDGGNAVFRFSPHQTALNRRIADCVVELAQDSYITQQLRGDWPSKLPLDPITVRIGPMASGASVLADGETVERIAEDQNRDLLAVDMEAYAVMAACEYVLEGTLGLVIKSVCDYGDEAKDDDWQDFSAHTSARFFDTLLRSTGMTEIFD